MCYASLNQRPRKMCNCAILDVTVKKILITAFFKKLPFLAKGLDMMSIHVYAVSRAGAGEQGWPAGVDVEFVAHWYCDYIDKIVQFSTCLCLIDTVLYASRVRVSVHANIDR